MYALQSGSGCDRSERKDMTMTTAVLKELLDKRDTIRKDEILSAIVKSGRSYEEIMNFLNVEETERETKE